MFTLKKAQWTRVQATRMLLSQLAEDAIKRINFDEVQAMNHAQCLERNTAVLVSTSLASKEHRHIEIDASTETTARVEEVKNRNATRRRYAAAPTTQANTIDFRWIKCPRRKQTWSSLSPDQGNFPVADLELLDYVERRGIGVDESDVFAKNAVIFYESNIIVRADTDDRWYAGLFFILACTCVHCAIMSRSTVLSSCLIQCGIICLLSKLVGARWQVCVRPM